MGGEILAFPLMALGAALCLFLIYRACKARSRPVALPTLIFSVLWACFFALTATTQGWFWTYFFINFAVGAVIFGAQAHLIKWLYEKRT